MRRDFEGRRAVKVLSVRQPWASLIVKGFKDVENRSWGTKTRGTVAIHASAVQSQIEWFNAMLATAIAQNILFRDVEKWFAKTVGIFGELPFGKIIGTADIVDCKREKTSPWHFDGNWGFYFSNPKEFKKFIPAKGKLGFWDFNL